MSLFVPLDHLRVRHNFAGDNWFDFTGHLTQFTANLREFSGANTVSLSFYYAPMDPSQSSGTHVIKKGDRVRVHMHKGDGSTWRKTTSLRVHRVTVAIDLKKPVGKQNLVTVHLHGTGVAGVAGIGGSSGVGSAEELSNVVTGAPFAINGEDTDVLTRTYVWTGTSHASTSTESDLGGEVQRTNLCANPSFETNTTGWSASAGSIATSSARAQVGTKSLLVTWPTSAANATTVSQTVTGLLAGEPYTASAWVFVPTGSPDVALTAGAVPTVGTPTSVKDAWTQVSVSWTSTATSEAVRLTNTTASTSGQTANMDAVLVEYGSDVLPYFDGATTDVTVDAITTPTDGTLLRTNLCLNPGMDGTLGDAWSAGGTGVAISQGTDGGFIGTNYLTATHTGGTGTVATGFTTLTGLTIGQTYTASGYGRSTSGITFNVHVTGTAGASVTPGSTWTRASVTFVATAATMDISFTFTNGSTGTFHGDLDAAQVEVGAVATPYFSGSFTDTDSRVYAWTGTPSDSMSTETATFTEVADIDTATEFDQIVLTRDSNPGHLAFEDPDGTVQIFDPDHHRMGGLVITFDDTDYSAIDEQDDLEHIVNVLHLHYFEKVKVGKKGTRKVQHTVTYTTNDAWASGKPYAGSIAKFGRLEKKHQIHKQADFQDYANKVFSKNAFPDTVPKSMTISVTSAAKLLGGYEDGHFVTNLVVVTDPNGVTFACRIARIQHQITPSKWFVQVFFREQSTIQRPRRRSLGTEVAHNPDGGVYGEAFADAVDATGKTISNAIVQTNDDTTTNRIVIRDDGSEGVIEFGTGTAGETVGKINPGVDGAGSHQIIFRTSHAASGNNATPGQLTLQGSNSISGPVLSLDGTDLFVDSAVNATGAVTAGANLSGNKVFTETTDTSTNAANAVITGANQIVPHSSLSRNKLDQEDLDLGAARQLLKLSPKTWLDRLEAEIIGGTEGMRRTSGLIAEDVEATVPHLAIYDAQGNLRDVDQQGALAALLLIVQDQQARIEALETDSEG